jgi:DNA-binding beta-propeller fold protein YncE
LRFEGYIELPRHGLLNVLDYLTIDNGVLFAAGSSSGSVYRIVVDDRRPTAEAAISEMRGVPHAHTVALAPSEHVAFVTRSGPDVVELFDPDTLLSRGRVPVPAGPDAMLFHRAVNGVYVASGTGKAATLLDLRGKVVGSLSLEGKPEFAVYDAQDDLVYQNIEDTNALVAIKVQRGRVVKTWRLNGCEAPTGLALDGRRRRLFVACSGNARLAVVDMQKGSIVASLPTAGGADVVAYDETLHRIYAASVRGHVTVIQQDNEDAYRVVADVSTHYGAHTLAVSPVSHRVYVAYASLFVKPRIAVFSARP